MAKVTSGTSTREPKSARNKLTGLSIGLGLALVLVGAAVAMSTALTPGNSPAHERLAAIDPVTNTRVAWEAGLQQLRDLNWQAALVLAAIGLAAALAATWFLRISWRFREPTFANRLVKGAAHTYSDHLRLNRQDCAKMLETSPETPAIKLAERMRAEHAGHFVVTIVESTTKRVCLYKEMHLQFVGRGGGVVDSERVQLGVDDLTTVRLKNGHPDDDDDKDANGHSIPVSGRYDVYIRPVQWYDVRHWLLHPNREIRIVVWVTIITTLFPMLLGYLFDGA